MIDWQWIIILIITLGVHELGHWLAFRYYKIKANVKFNWFMITVGDEVSGWLPPKKLFIVIWSGVMLGLVYISIFNPPTQFLLVYLLFCSADFVSIYALFGMKKDSRAVIDIQIDELQKWKEKNNIYKPRFQ